MPSTPTPGSTTVCAAAPYQALGTYFFSAAPAASWPVPAITSPAELARFLEVEPSELDWFADCQSRERSALVEALRHYRYRWVPKPSGSLRLIEAPKPRLPAPS